MTDRTLKDINRRELSLTGSLVSDVLPDYYREDHPKLISFLETYYNTLDSDHGFSNSGATAFSQRKKDLETTSGVSNPTGSVPYTWDSDRNFGYQLKNLPTLRDIHQTDKENLTFIEDELLLGQNYIEGTLDPNSIRGGAELSNNFYRSKGTKFGIERFFNLFFPEVADPEIIYGKDLVMKVGDNIGPESGRYITDDRIYQFWGLLIKIGISTSDWMELYKLFAHPAGMFAGGQVVIESTNQSVNFGEMTLPTVFVPSFILSGTASIITTSISELSGIIGTTKKPYDSEGSTPGGSYRIDLDQSRFDYYSTIGGTASDTNYLGTLRHLDNTFPSLVDLVRINSQTFDMDSDGLFVLNTGQADSNGKGVLRMSDGQITLDAGDFKYYSDSA